MRRSFLKIFVILAITTSAFAQQVARPTRSDAVDPARLREHINYLASDKLEGRRTGSAGASEAAHYIANEFARLKLRPRLDRARVPKDRSDYISSYMQRFPFVAGVALGKSNKMLFMPRGSASNDTTTAQTASLDLRLEDDWLPLGFSSNARVENVPVTFVGYGISAPDTGHDDYANADVAGRIALALEGAPDTSDPHNALARYADAHWKAIAARNAHARALVIIARDDNFKDDKLARLNYDNVAGDAALPVLVISRQAAARILTVGGLMPLEEIEKSLQQLARTSASSTGGRGGVSAAAPAPPAPSARASATESSTATTVSAQKTPSAPLKNVTLTIVTDIVRRESPAANVIGILDGSDPYFKQETIIIGAHYDHLGRGGAGSLAVHEGAVHHGADDNASGVAALLELARIFSTERARLKRTLVLIAFSGEEEGLLGSSYYVNHPVVPLEKTIAMINLDMIGRMKDKRLIIGGAGTANQWRSLIASANLMSGMNVVARGENSQNEIAQSRQPIVNSANGHTIVSLDPAQQFDLTLNEDGYGPSDHAAFYAKRVPVLFFFTGTHEDYHKPSDTADKINYAGEARIAELVARLIRLLDSEAKPLTYTVAKTVTMGESGRTGFRVYLGTIPSYAESTNGLTLDAVREDSPAAKAGLKAGDRIVKLAGRDVRNVYDYTYALGEMKAGVEYEVELVRGTETLKLKITPAARK
jgi:hypothetical protein